MAINRLLVDGDILLYKVALSGASKRIEWDGVPVKDTVGPPSLEDAKSLFIQQLGIMRDHLNPFASIILCLTVGKGYRYELDSTYKAHRAPRPEIIGQLKEWLMAPDTSLVSGVTAVVWQEGLEADDLLGMMQDTDTVICSIDKDLLQIPGWYFNWQTQHLHEQSAKEAELFFFQQLLSGDPADNIKGVPGIGPKKAREIVLETPLDQLWDTVVIHYLSCGKTVADAIRTARLVYILHPGDSAGFRWAPPVDSTFKETID